ncbi:DUF3016 domain-containing protein [Duganella qianjiadongensis]|uniref:DUF3016 domain-containing protein n=1 Tax=Duganella qianjiadongensis TaxID=2692176 RepID=A0ABW9VN33_9BURK|nr:DUF3016 domain-containing protein [Duganella qianjiadongensis]MYM40993.1 DUF3016 domain-containing protein [Duganella qianjiadongensis]
MRAKTRILLAAALLASGAAAAQVSVSYVKPEDYADVPRNAIERERVLKDFSNYFDSWNARLPAGQSLKIEVLDIDLAGRMWPRRNGGEDIRVLNDGADWPRMRLHYTLEQNGQTLRSGDEQLSNMSYMQRINRYWETDTLRYEKQMLDEWFDKTIVPKVAAR